MHRVAVLTIALFAFGCAHSAAPPLAPQSQRLVPLIIQTGTTPLQWAQISTNEPTGNFIYGVGRDPSGNEWFTEYTTAVLGGVVGYVSQSRAVTEWTIASPYTLSMLSIVAGPDGNMWFSIPSSGEVAKITPTGIVTRYAQSTGVYYVCNGPDGNLWFTTGVGIARITPAGVSTAFAIPQSQGYADSACHKGADGRVWFGEQNQYAIAVGAIDPATSTISSYQSPSSARILSMTTGPDGNIWVGLNPPYPSLAGTIGKITPGGSWTVYPLANGESASGIVSGPDGNIWFAGGRGIGEMTTAGTAIAWHPDPLLPKGVALTSLSAGSDGNLWAGTGPYSGSTYNIDYAAVDVFIHRVLTASPSPVLLASGTSTTLAISERHYNNTFTVTSADPSIATVVNTGTRTTFTVTGVAHGTTTLTIDDKYQNSLVVGVTVN